MSLESSNTSLQNQLQAVKSQLSTTQDRLARLEEEKDMSQGSERSRAEALVHESVSQRSAILVGGTALLGQRVFEEPRVPISLGLYMHARTVGSG